MTTKTSQPLNKILKSNSTSSLKSVQQNKRISFKKTTVSNTVKANSKTFKQASKPQTNTCMYDRIKERARKEQIRNSLLSVKTKVTNGNTQPIKIKQHPLGLENGQPINEPIIFDSEIFDTGENDDKKSCQQPIKISKFNKKNFILKKKLKTKNRAEKRPSMDESNRSSKRVKLQLTNNDEEHLIKSEICPNEISKTDDQQTISSNNNHEMIKLDESIDIKPILSQTTNQNQEDADNKQLLQDELASSQDLLDRSTSQSIKNEPFERILNISNASNDHHLLVTDNSLPVSSSDLTKPSTPSSLTTKTSLNLMNSQSITTHKHPPTSSHLLSQTLTPDNNLLSPYPHQHFSYPFFVPPDSPPSSTRTLSTSSCSSLITTPFHNAMISGQQNCHNKDSRRDSLTKFSGSSTPYFGTSLDSPSVFFNPSELYAYPTTNQQIINSCPIDFYRMNDIHSIDPFDIHWEGYIMLKTDQAYIKTQLIAGNSQIARLTINYWNTDLNDNLRISQRMRLEELQLNGVKKHMQMTNDHCILIAEPNGLTPDEILLEKNHLKNGVIQYLNEKKAAGILNILLPGVLQPVYVVHIFPPCQFASEILQERAPDAYRCVVQNKTEQIYLLFVITSTFE